MDCTYCGEQCWVIDSAHGDIICTTCGTTMDDTVDLNWSQRYEYVDNLEISDVMKQCARKCFFVDIYEYDLVKDAQHIHLHNPTYTTVQCCIHSLCKNQCEKNVRKICELFKFPIENIKTHVNTHQMYMDSIKHELQKLCDFHNMMSKPCMLKLRAYTPDKYVAPFKVANEIFECEYHKRK